MNTGFYENLDKNFEEALKLSMQNFSYEDLIEFLKTGNIPEKQNAALKIEELKTVDDASHWYGVKFEKAIPYLIKSLGKID